MTDTPSDAALAQAFREQYETVDSFMNWIDVADHIQQRARELDALTNPENDSWTCSHKEWEMDGGRKICNACHDYLDMDARNEGFVLVPREPTDAMLDAGRTAVMARDCSSAKWSPRQHYEACGASIKGIPNDKLVGYHSIIPKEQGATLVWFAMLAAAPSPTTPPAVKDDSRVTPEMWKEQGRIEALLEFSQKRSAERNAWLATLEATPPAVEGDHPALQVPCRHCGAVGMCPLPFTCLTKSVHSANEATPPGEAVSGDALTTLREWRRGENVQTETFHAAIDTAIEALAKREGQ